jgi:hypothetical protein
VEAGRYGDISLAANLNVIGAALQPEPTSSFGNSAGRVSS